jgi:hypothetical protein
MTSQVWPRATMAVAGRVRAWGRVLVVLACALVAAAAAERAALAGVSVSVADGPEENAKTTRQAYVAPPRSFPPPPRPPAPHAHTLSLSTCTCSHTHTHAHTDCVAGWRTPSRWPRCFPWTRTLFSPLPFRW